jgi:hypothetical protein
MLESGLDLAAVATWAGRRKNIFGPEEIDLYHQDMATSIGKMRFSTIGFWYFSQKNIDTPICDRNMTWIRPLLSNDISISRPSPAW